MKNILFAGLLVTTLSACSVGTPGMSVGVGLGTGIGRHIGLGTSINIPVGTNIGKAENNSIKTVEEPVVTYFDAQGKISNSAVKGGFHRQLLHRRSNEYVVQDFYSDNNRKRTDPYTVDRKHLLEFRAHPENGTLTVYAYNGNIMQQQTYQKGQLVNARY